MSEQPLSPSELRSSGELLNQALNNSCDHCRIRKIKCNSGKPKCSYCIRRGLSCTYSINKKKQIFSGTPLTLSLENLEDRIKKLELLSAEILQQNSVQNGNSQPSPYASQSQEFHSSLMSEAHLDPVASFSPSMPSLSYSSMDALTSELGTSGLSTGFNGLTINPQQNFDTLQVSNFNFNNDKFVGDPLSISELRRFLLASYRSKAEYKGFVNHHKQVLIELCLNSDLVMSAFCAVSCAHASLPFLDTTLTTRRRLVDHFLNGAKSLLVQYGYLNPTLSVVQGLILISIVEYERGNFSRSIMYVQSALSMAYVLGMHTLDNGRLGSVTWEGAALRKVWWEIFTMDKCSCFMLYDGGSVIATEFQVMMPDAHGHSLGFTLEQFSTNHIEQFIMDSDPAWRLLPAMRLKMSDILHRAHNLAATASKLTNPFDLSAIEPKFRALQRELAEWSRFASPNPFLSEDTPANLNKRGHFQTVPGDHPSVSASFMLLFNCAYILAYCPTLYWRIETVAAAGQNTIPDSCGVAAGYLITGIDLSKPEDPRGEHWHQVLPFFSYIGCLAFYRLFATHANNPAARATASARFEALYLELASAIKLFPVVDVFMAELRPFRATMQAASS